MTMIYSTYVNFFFRKSQNSPLNIPLASQIQGSRTASRTSTDPTEFAFTFAELEPEHNGGTWKADDPAPKTNPSGKSRRVIALALLGTTPAVMTASKKKSSRGSRCARLRRSTETLLSGSAMPLLCGEQATGWLLPPRGGGEW